MTIRDIAVAFGFDVDNKSVSQAENTIKGLKGKATKLLGALGIGFSAVQLKKFTDECTQVASDISEMQSKFDVVFKGMEKDVGDWANDYAKSIGRSKYDIKTYLADAQNLLVGFTDGSDKARRGSAKLAEQMTSLALDIASFANTDENVAVDRMTKAVMGQSEAARGLGAALTDSTRAEAMQRMELSGSYNDLDQYTKMLVNLNVIQYQSKDAIGDCANSLDRYESRTRQQQAAMKDLKAVVGNGVLPVMAEFKNIQTKITQGAITLAKKIFGETEEDNKLKKVLDSIHAVVKKLQPAFHRMTQTLSNGMDKARSFVSMLAEKLGGMDNVLKILGITAGAFIAVMTWGAITNSAKAFWKVLSKIGKFFGIAGAKVLGIIAVIVVLALVVEDFIHFLLGNDSAIGEFFDKAGIGSENARKKIFNAWKKIKDFLTGVWELLKKAAGMYVDTVKDFFDKHGEGILNGFKRAWGIIKKYLGGVWTFISQLASTLFGKSEDSIGGSTASTKDKLLGIWKEILESLSAIWDVLYKAGSAIFNVIATDIETVFEWIQTFWNKWGSRVLEFFSVLWDSLGGILEGFLDIVKGVANFISSVFTGDWQGAWNAIKQILEGVWKVIVNTLIAAWDGIKMLFEMGLSAVSSIWNAVWGAISSFFQTIWNGIVSFVLGILRSLVSSIKNKVLSIKNTIVKGFTVAINWIKSLPKEAVTWGSDFMNGFKEGITKGINKIVDKVKGLGEKIKKFLHFSRPDEGPLKDYESWMPDFMGGLADGIGANEDLVLNKVRGLVKGISVLMNAAVAMPATAAVSTVNNTSSSVVQNVNIDNTYSGGTPETQKAVSKTMKKSATDATTQMARALAYSRG